MCQYLFVYTLCFLYSIIFQQLLITLLFHKFLLYALFSTILILFNHLPYFPIYSITFTHPLSYYIYMLDNRQQRFKTIHLSKLIDGYRRLKTEQQVPFHRFNANNEEDKLERLNKATSKDAARANFLSRGSGKLNIVGIKQKTNPLQSLKAQAKDQLQKLSAAQKLAQIQHILRTTRDLCKKYGFFSITLAMLKFNFQHQNQNQLKISVWIHPDPRSTKPLHPIKKQTQFQCQLACVSELKDLLRMLFPTIQLGDGKTFGTVIGYLDVLKADMDAAYRKNSGAQIKEGQKKHDNCLQVQSEIRNNYLVMSAKNIKAVENSPSKQAAEEERNRKIFKTSAKNKETTSTLVSSMQSAIKQKLSPKIKKLLQTQQPHQLTKIRHNQDKTNNLPPFIPHSNQFQLSSSPSSPTHQTCHPSQQQNRNKMKLSMSGRKFMTMSTEIESQINNLFDSQMKNSNFYNLAHDVRQSKCFQLTRVAEQFQDLF